MTLRILPIAPPPVRTVNEYRKRKAAERRAALHAKLMREVQERDNAQREPAR